MSDIITVRDSDIVAAEINTIKEDTRRIMIANAVRIGGKLMEAKSMVPFGEWGKWLEEKVSYSQSTAEDLMKLYREYGEGQESLFDTWTKSETFGNLSYSKHLALLALPFAQRQEFAEENRVEEMSTRELNQAIREKLKAAQERAGELENQLKGAQMLAETRLEAVQDAKGEVSRLEETVESTKKQLEKETAAAEKLKKKLAKAEAAQKEAQEKLKQAAEDPQVPEEVMAQLRDQVAADAAKQATEDLRKELEEVKARADKLAAAEKNAREELASAQRAAKLANPEAVAFKVKFEKIQEDFGSLKDDLLRIRETNVELGKGLAAAVKAMLGNWLAELEE